MNSNFPIKTSFWFDGPDYSQQSLSNDISIDVAVIGGGFAGLSSALHLKAENPDFRIAVFETEHVGYGASGRSGGWLVPFPPLYWLMDDLRDFKRLDCYQKAISAQKENIIQILHDAKDEAFSESTIWGRHYLVARNRIEAAILNWVDSRMSILKMQNDFIKNSFKADIVGYPNRSVLGWETWFINPYDLVMLLRQRCLQKDIRIYEKTPIVKIRDNYKNLSIETKSGANIQSKNAIVATNAYLSSIDFGFNVDFGTPEHTYMIATEPLEKELIQAISSQKYGFGDPSLSYYCGRFFNDRLLFNGCDRKSNATKKDDECLSAYQKLHREMVRRFPVLDGKKLDCAWGGPVLQTSSDAPVIRAAKENSKIVFNVGYGGGSGISMALNSGPLTTFLITGRSSNSSTVDTHFRALAMSRRPYVGLFKAGLEIIKKF